MSIWKCRLCTEYFNTKQRVPRLLKCGDTFCSLCLKSLLQNGALTCPTHNKCFTDYNSTENITIDITIFSSLEYTELFCSFHEDTLAIRINLEKAEAYCENCLISDSDPIYYENLKDSLIWTLKYYESLREIPQVEKKKIKEMCIVDFKEKEKLKTNMDRLKLLQKLKFMSITIFCDRHESKKAEYMNFISKEVYCENCITEDVQNFNSISNENFFNLIIKRILWVRRSVNKLESTLNCEYNQLVTKSLKSLIIEYKDLQENLNKIQVILIVVKCKVCGSAYSTENEPWIYPCIGAHAICNNCISGKELIKCSFHNTEYHKSSFDLFFSFENRVPCCPMCKHPYNLKEKIPKELPCGHVICLKCLKLNYLDACPKVNKCNSCSTTINNLKCLPNCKFLIRKVRNAIIFCSKHRNRAASCIELPSLRSWCSECESECIKGIFLFKIYGKEINTESFLLNIFIDYLKSPYFQSKYSENEFKLLSSQEMLDEIRAGKEPQSIPQLLSSIPKGREIIDPEYPNNKSLLLRFMSLMPPLVHDPAFDYLCRPWRVECDKNQVEAVSFKSNSNIKLEGIILSQGIYGTLISIETLEIIDGQSLESINPRKYSYKADLNSNQNKDLIKIDQSNLGANRQGPYIEFLPNLNDKEIALAHLGASISLVAGEYYSILIKFIGEKVMLYKGNPFDLKEELWGSDGTLFHFSPITNRGGYYIEGQHNLAGPILGLIYENI